MTKFELEPDRQPGSIDELTRLFVEGDCRACVQWLFDRFAKGILAYFVAATRNVTEAEELLQELFLRILARVFDFDPRSIRSFGRAEGDMQSYLFGCARNLARGRWRARTALWRGGHILHTGIDAAPDLAAIDLGPLATASREEVRWLVTQALAQLRADDRVVLDLRFVEELPFAVIGTILGISEVAATSRYRRALARLRDLLPAAAGIDLNS